MTITVNAFVTANAGTDQTVCGAVAVSLSANTVTGGNWTGGTGTFNPNRNTANATYTPAAGEMEQRSRLHGMPLILMARVLVLPLLMRMTITVNTPVTRKCGS
jgi:hypothetical protein